MIIDAFKYMVVRLAIEYARIITEKTLQSEKLSLEYFEKNNDFNFWKCDLFPYLITIANGKREELFGFFNENFSAVDNFGIIQKDIHNYLLENLLVDNTGKQIYFTPKRCHINLPCECFDADGNINKEYFKSLHNSENYIKALDYIDSSIKFMHAHRLKRFATLDFNTLSIWSRSNQAYLFFEKREDFKIMYNIAQGDVDKEFISLAEIELTSNELSPL
jgi:hypothetical protein